MAPARKPQHFGLPEPSPEMFRRQNPFFNLKNFQRGIWLSKTTDHFHQLILWAERQPSNGTVRGVDRPDGETRFRVAYGNGPDGELRGLLEHIHATHGEVSLRHDGRDSTGKHWIKCFEKSQPGSLAQRREVAIICVSSKLEDATVPRPPAVKGKGREHTYGRGAIPVGL
ncbi:hypothetical protein BDR22DRAFT_892679 [Usnea florida]